MRSQKMNMIAVALAVLVLLSGCAELKDKFVPKKKEEPRAQRYYQVRPYDVHPSLDLYTKRYIYWKSWHRELLSLLEPSSAIETINYKKRTVAIEQEVSNLIDMQSMLVDEKAEPLGKIIDELAAIEKRIKEERITPGNLTRIRRRVDQLGKEIKRGYSYRDMGDYIAAEFREKSDEQAPADK